MNRCLLNGWIILAAIGCATGRTHTRGWLGQEHEQSLNDAGVMASEPRSVCLEITETRQSTDDEHRLTRLPYQEGMRYNVRIHCTGHVSEEQLGERWQLARAADGRICIPLPAGCQYPNEVEAMVVPNWLRCSLASCAPAPSANENDGVRLVCGLACEPPPSEVTSAITSSPSP